MDKWIVGRTVSVTFPFPKKTLPINNSVIVQEKRKYYVCVFIYRMHTYIQ